MSYLKYIRYFFIFFIGTIFIGCSSHRYPSYNGRFSTPKDVKMNNSNSMQIATMRPYRVGEKIYYPTTVSIGDVSSGIASWYGKDFHGKRTSNGEYYNMYDMTAAHKTLPMNTIVKVTNLDNLKSVVVRINDRGPFVKTRIIDLSYTAASRLGIVSHGTAPVRLKVIGFNGLLHQDISKVASISMSNYLVQIGAFRKQSGANRYANKYLNVSFRYKSVVKKYMLDGFPIYRVYLSGFKSENEARDFINKGMFNGAFIVGN